MGVTSSLVTCQFRIRSLMEGAQRSWARHLNVCKARGYSGVRTEVGTIIAWIRVGVWAVA